MTLRVHTARALAVAWLGLALGGSVSAAPSTAATAVVGTFIVHIKNFGRVGPSLYRGAQPDGPDYQALATLGIKTVINLTSDDADPIEQASTEHAGMHYVHMPMTTHQRPTTAQLTEFLRLVNDPAMQPVYVHCVGGRHRTGVMTAVYRMTADRWTADQAFKEMKQHDFGADFLHPEFKRFVYAFVPKPGDGGVPVQQATIASMTR